MSGLESLYQELILDHSKRPHGKGLGDESGRTATSHQRNPICGDEITLRVRVSDDGSEVAEVTWDGAGCSISQASASMLSQRYCCHGGESFGRRGGVVLTAGTRSGLC